MAENRLSFPGGNGGREIYGIETGRIMDACRDRDCFEDVRVYLTRFGEELIENTNNVRMKSADVVASYIGVDPVQFNPGFYTVDIRLYVHCRCEACAPLAQSQDFSGIAVLEKHVVLYGGESNIDVFRSTSGGGFCSFPEPVVKKSGVPEAVLETVAPVVLDVKVKEKASPCPLPSIPASVCECVGGELADFGGDKYLTATFGLFSVLRLVRDGQILVEGREYAIPAKECPPKTEEDPCGSFSRMPFPTAAFCPSVTPPDEPGQGGRRCCNS